MQINVQPDIIFLELIEEEEVRTSGIVVASSPSSCNRARIANIHVETAQDIGVNEGDTVVFNPYSVREVHLNGTTKRLAIHPGDILARVDD